MSIGSIASHLYQQYPISILGSTNPSSGAGLVSGPLQTSAPGAAAATPAGGLFDALMQALTQSGALTSTTAATSAAGTATTTSDAKATSAIGAGATSASDTASTSASDPWSWVQNAASGGRGGGHMCPATGRQHFRVGLGATDGDR